MNYIKKYILLKIRMIFSLFYRSLLQFGINPRLIPIAIKGILPYLVDLVRLLKQAKNLKFDFTIGTLYPCLSDRFMESGDITGHYFHQDLFVANRIFMDNPQTHIDVGSRIDGFVAHVASFRPLIVIDIRPLKNKLINIDFIQADLMQNLDSKLIECCDSLSCLHALEHFGLGRYGDQININGHIIGLENLYKMLKNNGKLYLSVPIGPQRIEFNAHRVFSLEYLIKIFYKKFYIENFSYVDDQGYFHSNVVLSENNIENNFGCYYGCGIFELRKVST